MAFGLTVLLMPAVLGGLRRSDALDHPNDRSSHDVPTLRGGGIGPWLACHIVVLAAPGIGTQTRIALLVVTGGFGLLGALEDFRGLSAGRRFLGQLLVAVVAAVTLAPLTDSSSWNAVLLLPAVLWLVTYVNAFNFMDGINGISAVQVLAAGVGLAVMGWQVGAAELTVAGAVVAGAALGFTPFNFPRARVFLGDAGSYFFGGWLALLAVVALVAGVPPEAAASPFLIYLADTGTTLVRRVLRGEPWRQPHRTHVYQRLTQLGWSHTLTTAYVGVAIAVCVTLGILSIDAAVPARIGAVLGMAAFVILYLATPALVARFATRRMANF